MACSIGRVLDRDKRSVQPIVCGLSQPSFSARLNNDAAHWQCKSFAHNVRVDLIGSGATVCNVTSSCCQCRLGPTHLELSRIFLSVSFFATPYAKTASRTSTKDGRDADLVSERRLN